MKSEVNMGRRCSDTQLLSGRWLRASGGLWLSAERTARGGDSLWRQLVPEVQSWSLPTPSCCSLLACLLPWQHSRSMKCTPNGEEAGAGLAVLIRRYWMDTYVQSCVLLPPCMADIDTWCIWTQTVGPCHEGRGVNMRGVISLLNLKGDFRLIDTLKKGADGSLISGND